MIAVIADKLTKNYAGEEALKGVSFSVDKGSLFGIIGADGAGKTTLMRILTTLQDTDSGTASVLGKNVKADFMHLRANIGYMPQRFSLYPDLTVNENLNFFADIFGITGAERTALVKRLLEFSQLAPFSDRRAKDLSGGMKQKLALSCTLIHRPQIVFLDEPTTGVDPVSRKEFWLIINEILAQGITVVVSTPYMDEAAACHSLLLLHQGLILAQGTPQKLLETYPLHLFKITGQDRTLSISRNAPLPADVVLMYPAAGDLHVAVKPSIATAHDVLSRLQSSIPDAQQALRVSPSVEDLFFYLLSTTDPTGISVSAINSKGKK